MGPFAEHRGNATKALSVFGGPILFVFILVSVSIGSQAPCLIGARKLANVVIFRFFLEPAPRLVGLLCQMHEHVHDPCVFVCSWIEEESVIRETDDGGHCAPLLSRGWAND
jgi:hypothetical protein